MNKTIVLTHRGLEEGNKKNFESSYEAFENHLSRGYGIEFDVNFTKDDRIVILHDKNLARITNGQIQSNVSDLNLNEIQNIALGENHVISFEELMNLIKQYNPQLSALHLKGCFQKENFIKILINHLKNYNHDVLDKIIIFDTTIETAKALLKEIPNLILCASVAHEYDIKRYNQCTNYTLLSIKEVIANKDLFKWVWLDEWDTQGPNNTRKEFYTKEVFESLREENFKISLVTQELHASSPGLLGGESHTDAKSVEILFKRIKRTLVLQPDAVCTDYPEEVRRLIESL